MTVNQTVNHYGNQTIKMSQMRNFCGNETSVKSEISVPNLSRHSTADELLTALLHPSKHTATLQSFTVDVQNRTDTVTIVILCAIELTVLDGPTVTRVSELVEILLVF